MSRASVPPLAEAAAILASRLTTPEQLQRLPALRADLLRQEEQIRSQFQAAVFQHAAEVRVAISSLEGAVDDSDAVEAGLFRVERTSQQIMERMGTSAHASLIALDAVRCNIKATLDDYAEIVHVPAGIRSASAALKTGDHTLMDVYTRLHRYRKSRSILVESAAAAASDWSELDIAGPEALEALTLVQDFFRELEPAWRALEGRVLRAFPTETLFLPLDAPDGALAPADEAQYRAALDACVQVLTAEALADAEAVPGQRSNWVAGFLASVSTSARKRVAARLAVPPAQVLDACYAALDELRDFQEVIVPVFPSQWRLFTRVCLSYRDAVAEALGTAAADSDQAALLRAVRFGSDWEQELKILGVFPTDGQEAVLIGPDCGLPPSLADSPAITEITSLSPRELAAKLSLSPVLAPLAALYAELVRAKFRRIIQRGQGLTPSAHASVIQPLVSANSRGQMRFTGTSDFFTLVTEELDLAKELGDSAGRVSSAVCTAVLDALELYQDCIRAFICAHSPPCPEEHCLPDEGLAALANGLTRAASIVEDLVPTVLSLAKPLSQGAQSPSLPAPPSVDAFPIGHDSSEDEGEALSPLDLIALRCEKIGDGFLSVARLAVDRIAAGVDRLLFQSGALGTLFTRAWALAAPAPVGSTLCAAYPDVTPAVPVEALVDTVADALNEGTVTLAPVHARRLAGKLLDVAVAALLRPLSAPQALWTSTGKRITPTTDAEFVGGFHTRLNADLDLLSGLKADLVRAGLVLERAGNQKLEVLDALKGVLTCSPGTIVIALGNLRKVAADMDKKAAERILTRGRGMSASAAAKVLAETTWGPPGPPGIFTQSAGLAWTLLSVVPWPAGMGGDSTVATPLATSPAEDGEKIAEISFADLMLG
jgi:hypothetical protein